MGIDINLLRSDRGGDPEVLRVSQRARGKSAELVDEAVALDVEHRKKLFLLEQLQKQANKLNKDIGLAFKGGQTKEADELKCRSKDLSCEIQGAQNDSDQILTKRNELLHKIGNLVDKRVPVSMDEVNNRVELTFSTGRQFSITPLPHAQVMAKLGLIDVKAGINVCGHRGYFSMGDGALLIRALINYGTDFLLKKNFVMVQPPYFMRRGVMAKTCELKDFDQVLYEIPKQSGEEAAEDLFLIATAEQPLSALHMNEALDDSKLPLKYCGVSPCFRKEAGAHGKDVNGIFRVHQFDKVEQFILCAPSMSNELQEEMMLNSRAFYESLGLSYRVVSIVSGALNDAAAIKYDIEAWFPGTEQYRELVSCSNCTDYVSRDLHIRYGQTKEDRDKLYVHLLNGTLVAAQRTFCCLLENYQTETGVTIPPPLVPYMGGRTFIPFPV